jgi:mannose-1-phosphate guanylyltransferase
MLDTAVILVGGKGMRLRPLTDDKPKSMVIIKDRPIIEWIILWLKKNGVTNIVLSVDYKKEVLINHLGNGESLGVHITYNDHTGSDETGDALRLLLKKNNLPQTFFVLYGDQITDLPLKNVFEEHRRQNPLATLVTCPVRMPYGIVETAPGGTVQRFREKPILSDILMNAGIYIFEKDIEPYLPSEGSIANTTLVELAKIGKLHSYAYSGFFMTVSDTKDIKEGECLLEEQSNLL